MNNDMKRTVLFTVGLIVIVAGFLAAFEFLKGPRSMFAGFDGRMHRQYEAITMGTSKSSAVHALGEPRSKDERFNLPQREGIEHYFDAAERSTAVEYLLWGNGMNWYYCIGFDAGGQVVVKREGSS